ncbi:ectoine/hydroxyectoine ABC transporter ATP-binding protein EhuA [Mesorhizobium erdmanii]|uniref:Ectoine/hydroxyectoine ABC transporter ATP-binding protein EhuA n=2 Tax=Mesorhizobium TaxID=68287 RepID=A0A3M9X031_9HYPH|nr:MULTISPECIES: ectoine/hydroxyectoine ABC transporter ATP-binding protein EhuA [Mesorhizobium]RNJ41076.1 ectoine/hydroxyectoine ABC transporter ATP-binding protein EhuA [Mesorhizobium japonicum]RXT45886.1 ectoine/hydroxyectoine ABC transporter ATP-binding protein EhuA [Mesorhizobium erdmanii]
MSQSQIEFDGVVKSFGNLKVLDNLSFKVMKGEKLALIGPSGSGKTTILRILMTLERIDSGHVQIDGVSLWQMRRGDRLVAANEAHLHQMRKNIGMVFQLFNLFPHMTVLKNVTIGQTRSLGVPPAKAEKIAMELLSTVGLTDKAQMKPGQLSGGQKQRVAIARALALKPRIMLFDEVTSALDPELVEEVLNVIRQIGRESDMTMILVTHEMNFAKEFADRVLFFDGGKILEEGPPKKIFTNPERERTQAFLRKMTAAGIAI